STPGSVTERVKRAASQSTPCCASPASPTVIPGLPVCRSLIASSSQPGWTV
ncbi:hypothetical protein V5799_008445, partial [Amblyomma americanum]